MRMLDFAATQGWALLPEVASQLADIASRAHETKPELLEAYRAQSLERAERAGIRGDVAVLNVEGPLFKKANLFVEFSGATSYQILRRDLQAALDNPKINSILLVVDSPGGEANGCDELAAAIYEARSKKPITAFVSGMAASGGYWIASAASRIVVSDAAMLGSIGVVLGIPDRKAADERRGIRNFEFVSSQSPGKRPDPASEAGKSQIQTMVDDLAEVFIAAVAKYRGVTPDAVVKRFGSGGIKVGRAAVRAGMADEVGQLEATIASLQWGRRSAAGGMAVSASEPRMTAATVTPAPTDILDAAGRIKAILTSENGKLIRNAANFLAFETSESVETCLSILAAARICYDERLAAIQSPAPTSPAMSYFEHKKRAGALGTEDPSNIADAGSRREMWKRAVDDANASFDAILNAGGSPNLKPRSR